MTPVLWLLLAIVGIALIVWGAETFAEHLSVAAVRLGVSTFALALLLAGAEPEELATSITAARSTPPCDPSARRIAAPQRATIAR